MQATSGAGFISSSVFGVQENTAIADMAGDQGDVSFPGMMSICSTQARALESSAGLLMVSPFLPDRLRHSNWYVAYCRTDLKEVMDAVCGMLNEHQMYPLSMGMKHLA